MSSVTTLMHESTPVKPGVSRRGLDHLRRSARRLAAYHGWPVLHLAEDVVVANRGPWLRFLRTASDDELLYALAVLRARMRLIGAPRAIRALLDREVA